MKCVLILTVLLAIMLLLSCGEKSVTPGDEITSVQFDDYVIFETGLFLAKYQGVGYAILPEPAVCGEKHFGEPFIDENDNGVYEPEIDIFIMCECPDNMDYDFNGRYTGPNEGWEPGIPFDDLNGNGEYDIFCYDYYDYVAGAPFADYNGNGVWDANPQYAFDLEEIVCIDAIPGEVTYTTSWVLYDSLFFVSDSGIVYDMPNGGNCAEGAPEFSFVFKDSGLYFSYLDNPGLTVSREFFVIDTGSIEAGVEFHRLVNSDEYYILHYDRTVEIDYELEIDGVGYSDVLLVKFDNPDSYTPSGHLLQSFDDTFFEFYFSKAHGFLGFKTRPMSNYSIRTQFYNQKLPNKHITMIQ